MTALACTPDLVEPVDVAPAATLREDRSASDAARAAAGDLGAFERLYHAHAGRVRALVRRMLSTADADEVVQDVFVRAWSRLASFRGEAAFGTWLHRVAINVCLAHRQSEGTARRRFLDDDAVLSEAMAVRRTPELAMDIDTALARLPAGMRRILVLHDIEGYTHEEIAAQFGIAAGTSKSQLHRARLALRPMLER